MDLNALNILAGLVVVSLFGVASIRMKTVDLSGLAAGFIVGFLIFIFGSWKWFTIILAFHLIAGVFTKYKYESKKMRGAAEEMHGARAWRNVIANGGVAAAFSVMEGVDPHPIFLMGFLGAVSTALTDTLATEIGLLYPSAPRLIINMKKTKPGTSGAISPLGELAIILGAIAIGLTSWSLTIINLDLQKQLLIALVSGFSGSTIDSLIGATIQSLYKCQICGKITEKRLHCGKSATHTRGIQFFDNNIVNLVSTAFGAITAIMTYLIFYQ
jgi:uncharacterized protein (TIGR00297 family)